MMISTLRDFTESVLGAAGSAVHEAAAVADVLVWCDSVERHNQGVWRLPILCERLERGLFETPCDLQLSMKTKTVGLMDGGAGQGHYVARQAMEEVIAIAQSEGIAALAVSNSNFFGAAGFYAAMAAQADLIGIAMSNSFPKVRAFNGEQAVLGTNPLAFACPAQAGRPLILDMATSAQAGSTVRKQQEAKKNSTSHPVIEPWGSAKGYGLALMVEILSGVLSGAGFSHQVKSMYHDFQSSGSNGHFFLAIDIDKLMPRAEFAERMGTLLEYLRTSSDTGKVKYPGETRWDILEQTQANGVELDEQTRTALEKLAKRYGVASL